MRQHALRPAARRMRHQHVLQRKRFKKLFLLDRRGDYFFIDETVIGEMKFFRIEAVAVDENAAAVTVFQERLVRHVRRLLERQVDPNGDDGAGDGEVKRVLHRAVDPVERVIKVPDDALESREAFSIAAMIGDSAHFIA